MPCYWLFIFVLINLWMIVVSVVWSEMNYFFFLVNNMIEDKEMSMNWF